MDITKHIETINNVKKYIDEKDYEGLKKYIQIREYEVLEYREENTSSDYIENLVDELI